MDALRATFSAKPVLEDDVRALVLQVFRGAWWKSATEELEFLVESCKTGHRPFGVAPTPPGTFLPHLRPVGLGWCPSRSF